MEGQSIPESSGSCEEAAATPFVFLKSRWCNCVGAQRSEVPLRNIPRDGISKKFWTHAMQGFKGETKGFKFDAITDSQPV